METTPQDIIAEQQIEQWQFNRKEEEL